MYKTEVTCMTNVSSSTADKPVTDYDSESASAHKPDYESASIGNVSDKAGYHTKKDVDKPDYVPYPSKTKIHMDIHSNCAMFITMARNGSFALYLFSFCDFLMQKRQNESTVC